MVSASAIIGRIIDFIENHVDLPEEKVTPSIVSKVFTAEEIEDAALKVRRDWGLGVGPISNVVHLLETNGVLVFRLLSDCKKVDAFSLWHKSRPFIFLSTEKGSGSRSRFDAAHELGHLIMHSDCVPGDRIQEDQANRFASAFLLPRDGFLEECPKRLVWPHFIALKERWIVSLAALIRRARDLGVISDDTYRRGNIQLHKRWNSSEPSEPEIERPVILPQVIKVLGQSGWPLSAIAEEVRLSETDIRLLTHADDEEALKEQENYASVRSGS